MAIIKNNYSNPEEIIAPYYLYVEQDVRASRIIIGDWPPNLTGPRELSSLAQRSVWLRVSADYRITILTSEPVINAATAITSTHVLDTAQIKVKGGEVFVIGYQDGTRNEDRKTELTGYQFGALDHVLIKLDQDNNTITVYQ